MQFIETSLCGVVGLVESLKGQGTKVVAYVNKLDQFGQHVGSQKIVILAFNDAERVVLRNNTRKGDFIVIRNGMLELNTNQENSEVKKFPALVRCNWYNQLSIIEGNNYRNLSGRKESTIA